MEREDFIKGVKELYYTTFAIGMTRDLTDEDIEYLVKNETEIMLDYSSTLATALTICDPDEEEECRRELRRVNRYLNNILRYENQ